MKPQRTRSPQTIASAALYEQHQLTEFMNEARLSIESKHWPGARLSLGKARMIVAELCRLGEEMQRAQRSVNSA